MNGLCPAGWLKEQSITKHWFQSVRTCPYIWATGRNNANNLYGWAMSRPLPVSNFKWMTYLENWREISSKEGRGCILEVDLEYPKELHNDYPLAPERTVVNKVENLIPTLRKKDKYVLHHRNVKQYLEMG